MNGNPVAWFEIYVQDMARAKAFYEAVMQVELTRLPVPDVPMYAFPAGAAGSGSAGSLVCVPGMPSGGNSVLVYFSCVDCAIEADRVVAAGGRLHRGKMSIGQFGHCALAFDTEGNLFGLHSRQ